MLTPRALSAALLLMGVTAGGPPTGGTVVDSTGRADVTVELQALFDEVPDGGVVRLAQSGRYRVEGTLRLEGRVDLTVDGNGARLFATTEGDVDRSQLVVVGGSGLVIHDLEIVGANPNAGLGEAAYQANREAQHGIRLEGTTDVELTRVQVSDVYGDFVYVGRDEPGNWSERIWIHDSQFTRNGRQGISVTSGRDVVIERNTISATRRATFDLEPNGPSGGAQNVHILDNDIGAGRLLFLAATGQGPVSDVVVAGNRLHGHALNMIVRPPGTDRRSGFYVVGNTSDEPTTRPPMDFSRIDGLVVTGNTQPITGTNVPAVEAYAVCGLVVEGNILDPGARQVLTGQAPCGERPDLAPPAAPMVAGRPISGAGPPPTSSTGSTSSTSSTTIGSPSEPTSPPPASPSPPTSDDGAGRESIAPLLAAIVGVAGASYLTWVASNRRRRRAGSATLGVTRSRTR